MLNIRADELCNDNAPQRATISNGSAVTPLPGGGIPAA